DQLEVRPIRAGTADAVRGSGHGLTEHRVWSGCNPCGRVPTGQPHAADDGLCNARVRTRERLRHEHALSARPRPPLRPTPHRVRDEVTAVGPTRSAHLMEWHT